MRHCSGKDTPNKQLGGELFDAFKRWQAREMNGQATGTNLKLHAGGSTWHRVQQMSAIHSGRISNELRATSQKCH
jgi:hypothetical protein